MHRILFRHFFMFRSHWFCLRFLWRSFFRLFWLIGRGCFFLELNFTDKLLYVVSFRFLVFLVQFGRKAL